MYLSVRTVLKVSLPVSMTPAQAGSVTAISGLPPENRRITSFFSEYIHVTPSADKTGKVIRTITSRFGMQFYESIYQAAMSGEPSSGRKMDKADAIYETILLALASGDGQKVLLSLGEPCVYRIFEPPGDQPRSLPSSRISALLRA